MSNDKALLIVDVQNDFCPGGSLGIPGGDQIIPFLNGYIRIFRKHGLPVFASRDWHPEKTCHFSEFGGPWPAHCVQGSEGARFHPDLGLPPNTTVLSKGMDPQRDDYSAFQAVTEDGGHFPDVLRHMGITRLFIGGLATDYCVRATALEALAGGFKVIILEDAVRGVDASPGDSARAMAELTEAGADTTTVEKMEGRLQSESQAPL